MNITLTTPALLFPATSLLLLAYTNRFLAIANLIRTLHARYKESPTDMLQGQIANLTRRLLLIRNMQLAGVMSLLLCVVSMILLYVDMLFSGEVVFGLSLITMALSLLISLQEIWISVNALRLHLSDMESSHQLGR